MQRRRAVSRKQNRRVHALITLIFCIAVFILVCAGCFLLVKTDGTITNKPNQSQGNSSSTAPDGADSTTDGDSQQEQPTMTEEEQRIADATSTASANCTKDAPQVVDPALWDERGKALMEQLAADEFYQSEGLKYSAKDGCPYMIAVNRAASTVTVLALDDEGNYTKPYMAMVCSGGADTPLGFFATPVNYDWRLLAGPSYGQYATRIWDSYLFHTVPYYSQHKDDIEYDQFNQLGTQASLGCIRLLVCDVKWIYDNCPIGTRVVIYDNADDPGPMGKPGERRGQFLRLVVGKLPARLPVPLLLPDIGVIPPEGRERHELPRPLFPAYRFHAVSLRCVRRLDYCASVRWRAPLNSSPLSVNSSRSAALCRLSHAACSSPFPPPADP